MTGDETRNHAHRASPEETETTLANLGREIELLAASADLARRDDQELFDRAAVLRENAMGIIYDGDGSTEQERIGRLIALVPALLTVVDEARDTIERLRVVAAEKDPAKLVSPYDVAGKSAPSRPTWDS
ncbi:MAG TPA: hypothetical protein PK781_05565 [Terrimesophilobacter sp.]|nr:hypothetical protein [Terrimesophilobacter sp.]HRP99910.1 hypothetical protein [Terrimesophilobacter sp.]